jgi:uncharacterized peroxidase-related enzyme
LHSKTSKIMVNSVFSVPTRAEVSANNQNIFDNFKEKLGFMPNLYAYFAKNDTALGDYLALQNRKSTLTGKEREVIYLVTSQINDCRYCQSAHTALGKKKGYSYEQILEIRKGKPIFDTKLDALARFTASIVENRGRATEASKKGFFEAGYEEANMIDVVMVIGDKIISNYLHGLTNLPIDFPIAEKI